MGGTSRAATVWRSAGAVVAMLVGCAMGPAPARAGNLSSADPAWTTTLVEENDLFTPEDTDKHYTQGLRLSTTTGDVTGLWSRPFRWMPSWLFPSSSGVPGPAGALSCRYNIILLGQNIYTPTSKTEVPPDKRDRPYAGWLYGGLGMMQDTGGRGFEDLELKLGVVGPGALGNKVQTDWHFLIEVSPFMGWSYQLRHQVAADVYYQRKWRLQHRLNDAVAVEALPQASIRFGNVYDYVGVGGLLRLGHNLDMDYGPPHIDLNTGADYINPGRAANPQSPWGWYGFVGNETRFVGYNVFLDGTPGSYSSVDKYWAVADLEAGFAVLYGHWRFAYTYVFRTPEFVHQAGPDHYGSLSLSLHVAL
jgi:lipid A 3-O-deacylase